MDNHIFDGLKVIDCAQLYRRAGGGDGAVRFRRRRDQDRAARRRRPLPPASPSCPAPGERAQLRLAARRRNKRSLALDLAKPEAQAVLHRLVARRRRVHHQLPAAGARASRDRLRRPGAAQRAADLRLVHRLRRDGRRGQQARLRRDRVVGALGADGHRAHRRPRRRPARPVPGMGDHPSAMGAYGAIVTALYQRERTGRGTYVSSSLLANGLWANGYLAQAALCGAELMPRPPREQALQRADRATTAAATGRWLILTLLNEERHWPVLAKCLGPGGPDHRPALRHASPTGSPAPSELVRVLDEVFATPGPRATGARSSTTTASSSRSWRARTRSRSTSSSRSTGSSCRWRTGR